MEKLLESVQKVFYMVAAWAITYLSMIVLLPDLKDIATLYSLIIMLSISNAFASKTVMLEKHILVVNQNKYDELLERETGKE